MSAKTKIVVLRMKEVIYTGIFVALGILLVLLLVFMFRPKNNKAESLPTETTAKYTAGVYTTPLVLNNSAIDVEVVVDEDNINAIRLVNLSETVTTMFPLVEPALEDLAEQIYAQQSTDNITYSESSKYTSLLLLDAIDSALDKAVMDSVAGE